MIGIFPFKPPVMKDHDKAAFSRDVYYFIWTAAGILTALWVAMMTLFPSRADIWLTFYVPMMAAFVVGLWLNSKGESRSTILLLLVSAWTVLTLMGVLYWNRIPIDNNRYLLLVVASGLLFGKKAGFLAAGVCGAEELIFALLIKEGVIASAAPLAPMHMLLPHLFFLSMAAVMPMFATRRVRVALSIAEDEREERKRAEEVSRENESRFLSIIDGSPDAIIIHTDGKLVHLNPASLKFVRAESIDTLLGKPIMEIVHPDSRDLVTIAVERMERTGTSSQIRDGKMLRVDGSVALVETASMPVSFNGRQAIQTIIKDVTEIRQLQEQMHLRIAALKSAGDGIIITARDGTIVWANPAFETLTGYSLAEVKGNNPRSLVRSGKQKPSFYKDMWSTIASGEVWRGELVNRRKDGTLYDEHMTITPVRDELGEVTHFVAVKQDITARKRLEEQLLQSQKLEGIGQLAGGVAHDYNNILNVVVGHSDLLKRKMSEDDPRRQSVDAILSAARRGADLTRQLLAFARKEIVSPKVIDVNSSVDSIRNMLHRIIGENLRLVFLPGKNLWNIRIDPTQFDQLLINLATNARDAIEDVGTITIRTSNTTITEENAPARTRLSPGEYVTVSLEDNGKGMDARTMRRIFEPFFTTKPKGHGTGLGLSTVYGILKQNGGSIEVKSEPGKGSVFTIYVPRFDGDPAPSAEQAPDESLRGNETVLVVEDEADLLNLAKTFLEECGYNVITSIDPTDAELLSEAYAGRIHLLLTDVVMPKMSGKELSDKIAVKRPGLKTLYMSGYGSDGLASVSGASDGNDFIQKPFALSELAQKVRQVLTS